MPATHHDVLEAPESLRNPFLGAIGLHMAVVGAMVGAALLAPHIDRFGDPGGGGMGSVTVDPVQKIPMYRRTERVNPVANDTQSQVPERREREQKRPEPDPDAIGLNRKKDQAKKKKKLDLGRYYTNRRREEIEELENQLLSRSGAQASTPLFGAAGAGGVGIGNNNPFGNRFGAYAQLIRDKVGRNWRTDSVPASIKTAPMVVVQFEIFRDGTVRGVKTVQSSGNGSLNYSCERAVLDSSPFEPLPAGFERSSATVEIAFQLQR
jgi:protein TonB